MKQFLVVLGIASMAAFAQAATLGPGDTLYKTHPSVPAGSAYSTALPPFGDGANLVANLSSPITGEFDGTITSQVFRDPVSNILSFHYTIALTDMNEAAIVRATMGGWNGIDITDAGANASGSSGTFDGSPEWTDGDPLFLSRPTPNGIELQWRSAINGTQIGTVIGGGDTSSVAFFVTNATNWTQGEMDLIDTSVTGESTVLIPVPEPSALALMSLGVIALVMRRQNR